MRYNIITEPVVEIKGYGIAKLYTVNNKKVERILSRIETNRHWVRSGIEQTAWNAKPGSA